MLKKRLPLAHSTLTGYYVDVPSYRMLPDTWLPITPGLIYKDGAFAGAAPAAVLALSPSVVCELPAETPLDDLGKIDQRPLQKMYATHPRFGKPDYVPPVATDPT